MPTLLLQCGACACVRACVRACVHVLVRTRGACVLCCVQRAGFTVTRWAHERRHLAGAFAGSPTRVATTLHGAPVASAAFASASSKQLPTLLPAHQPTEPTRERQIDRDTERERQRETHTSSDAGPGSGFSRALAPPTVPKHVGLGLPCMLEMSRRLGVQPPAGERPNLQDRAGILTDSEFYIL